ncbi:hypothetical protein IH879_13010 [candidate division KSB1 bacterium]|nr:hypothetical protein [candidate division KSB1 bacterium]
MNTQNITVVIQGPVYSPGITWSRKSLLKLRGYSHDSDLIVHFDSSSTILRNIRQCKNRNINVIYSGWFGDCSDELAKKIKGLGAVLVLSNQDSVPVFPRKEKNSSKTIRKGNKARQFYSLLRGLEVMGGDMHDNIVIKIRSDIEIDFNLLFSEIRDHEENLKSGSILVQHLLWSKDRNRPELSLPDFWFAARGDVLHSISKDISSRCSNDSGYDIYSEFALDVLRYYLPNFPKVVSAEYRIKLLAKDFFIKLRILAPFFLIREIKRRFVAYLTERKMRITCTAGRCRWNEAGNCEAH